MSWFDDCYIDDDTAPCGIRSSSDCCDDCVSCSVNDDGMGNR